MTLPTLPNLARHSGATPLPHPLGGQGGARSRQGALPQGRGRVHPHVLYRFWNADNELLYIGITVHLPTRLTQHRAEKDWWAEVTAITLEHYNTREDVLAAERAAIEAEWPIWNIKHNTSRATEPNDEAEQMLDICTVCEDWYGEYAGYFPLEWGGGLAHYVCRHDHRWTCHWGHELSGVDPTRRGQPFFVGATEGHEPPDWAPRPKPLPVLS